MYNHLISNLKANLEVFDKEDCNKVKDLLEYLKMYAVPLKVIKNKNYEYYKGICYIKKVPPMTEWQFSLIKTELDL